MFQSGFQRLANESVRDFRALLPVLLKRKEHRDSPGAPTRFGRASALWATLAGLSRRRRHRVVYNWRSLLLAVLVALPLDLSAAQARGTVDAASLRRLPTTLQRHLVALGNRAAEQGGEETEFTGLLADESGKSAQARIVYQLSGEVVLERINDERVVAFDGKAASGESGRLDEVLLESFAHDTVEGMFASLFSGAAFQILGLGFGPDSAITPDYSGPRYDIYDVTLPTRTRRDRALRTRRYYFDSASGLLVRTRYIDPTIGNGVQVETRFSEWQEVNGSRYPGRVERFEDGRLVFSFRPTAVHSGPGAIHRERD